MSHSSSDKIKSRTVLKKLVRDWQQEGKKIVFTNGCFDILHPGHVQYLSEAAAQGDKLVIGLNSDASVRELGKEGDRPVNPEADRAAVLAALEVVDALTIFGENTPYELITELLPDVLVKGGDWEEVDIVGGDIVRGKGGEVISLPFLEGYSTSRILENIRKG